MALGIVYVIWGSTYLGIAVMVQTLPPLVAAGVRYSLAGVILLAALVVWHRLRGRPFERPSRAQWGAAIVIGSLLLLGGNGGVVLGEQLIATGIAALVVATSPIWMALFEAIVARERPSLLTIAGLVAGTTGVAILVVPLEGSPPIDPLGLALVAGAAISWSIGSVYSKRAPRPASPFTGAGLQMLAGGLVMLLVGIVRGELAAVNPAAFSTDSLLALLYLIVFGSLVAFTAYIWLLNHAAITRGVDDGLREPHRRGRPRGRDPERVHGTADLARGGGHHRRGGGHGHRPSAGRVRARAIGGAGSQAGLIRPVSAGAHGAPEPAGPIGEPFGANRSSHLYPINGGFRMPKFPVSRRATIVMATAGLLLLCRLDGGCHRSAEELHRPTVGCQRGSQPATPTPAAWPSSSSAQTG